MKEKYSLRTTCLNDWTKLERSKKAPGRLGVRTSVGKKRMRKNNPDRGTAVQGSRDKGVGNGECREAPAEASGKYLHSTSQMQLKCRSNQPLTGAGAKLMQGSLILF